MKSIDVFCVFPAAVDAMMGVGVVGKAIETGLVDYRSFSFRDYVDAGKRIDDSPYGGGAGMVIRPDVVARAFREVYGVPARQVREGRRVVITEPGGRLLTQGYAEEAAAGRDITIVCGRYGGIDGRVREHLCSEAVSLGEFVLSGGEIAAIALADAAVRQLDGVLGNSESLVGESFSGAGAIGPPVYTRPAEWDGEGVPGVLLSGDHAKVDEWRLRHSRRSD
ncbi:tRNA (guanosine(37)-N1)-methyltransferase TrmD [Rubrobacter indicoceani]|uniref:tRNA (guanosine(37)-N1)-methyltransferase TrmD n=1 Tax=Rubrobacter indicoceani TaxID=2051957 RepID=UPI000E5B8858|nr:tRNA (guanosine(37)-N1)-methyltransferase TrmD [Rubrobacter indicoceani]